MKPKPAEQRKIQRMVGRTIVAADPHMWRDTDNRLVHRWRIELDDGTVLRFVAEPLAQGGDYGVDIELLRRRSSNNGNRGKER